MKTAMQELIEWYQREHFVKTTFYIQLLNKFEELLEKEKEQIKEAHSKGNEMVSGIFVYHDGEDYYNKIYNKNK